MVNIFNFIYSLASVVGAPVVSSVGWVSVLAVDSVGSGVVVGVVDSVELGSIVPVGSLVSGGVVTAGVDVSGGAVVSG